MLAALKSCKKGMTFALNWVLIVAVFLLVFSVVWGVLTRSVIGPMVIRISGQMGVEPWTWLPTGQAEWTEEVARYLLIWVAMLGGAVAFGTKGHLGVDYFVGKLHPDVQKMMSVVVHLIVLFFAVSIFLYGGWQVVVGSMKQTTQTISWLMKGHVYMVLPLSGIFMVIYTVENLIETLVTPAGALCEADGAEEID